MPISTTSISFVGFESRSTMLPASCAACVPVFIAMPTSAWASAGASLVPSPVIATRLPPSCSLRMRASLCSGVACGEEIVDAGLARDRGGREGIVARDHDVRMPIARRRSKRSFMPPLTTSLQAIDAHDARAVGDERAACAPSAGDL